MNNRAKPEHEGGPGLWKAVAAALILAAIVLLVFVLPAEYGVDPTSAGRLIGLDRLHAPASQDPGDPPAESGTDELDAIMAGNTVAAEPGTHAAHRTSFVDSRTQIQLESLEEVEWKARMGSGDTLVYSWEASAPVYADTHGEPLDYPDSPAVRYDEQDGVSAAHGRISATFDGLHGWYWLNTNEGPITITLKISGYYGSLDEIYRNQP